MASQGRNKWRNQRCEYDGMKFSSHKERDRYIFLKSQQRLGLIKDLRCQVSFQLLNDEFERQVVHLKTKDKFVTKKTFTGIVYMADFVYTRVYDNKEVVEDVKSDLSNLKAVDPVFFIKEKMMHSLLGIDIKKVDKATEGI